MPAVFRPIATCGVLVSCANLPEGQVRWLADAAGILAEPPSGLAAVSAGRSFFPEGER
jgi:hypothetical protein